MLIGIALDNLNGAFDASDEASFLQLVPAHSLDGHVADESDTLLPEISFHKLGNARAKAIRRDLLNDRSTHRLNVVGVNLKAVETCNIWLEIPADKRSYLKIWDLLWDEASPYTVSLQFLSAMLISGEKQHVLGQLFYRTLGVASYWCSAAKIR